MFCKKIFVHVAMMLFIVSMMIFAVGCDNETAANSKVPEKSFEAQKIREGLDLFNSLERVGKL